MVTGGEARRTGPLTALLLVAAGGVGAAPAAVLGGRFDLSIVTPAGSGEGDVVILRLICDVRVSLRSICPA